MKISARKSKIEKKRISQGDIFTNIEIIENIHVAGKKVLLHKIFFPYIICLNQECDLESDFNCNKNKDNKLLHLAIAPVFNFEEFLIGEHWGEIFDTKQGFKIGNSDTKAIINNENPRYHHLFFDESDMPQLIVDFKHFFTLNRDFLYTNIDNRLCSLDDLFKEKVSQRFSQFISRIGLPEKII